MSEPSSAYPFGVGDDDAAQGVAGHDAGTLEVDTDLALIDAALDRLAAALLAAPAGALGISATGLRGNVDRNLELCVRIEQRVHALYAIAGARADAASETWQGLSTLLRATAKTSNGEIAGTLKAGSLVVEHPQVAEQWLNGGISAAQVRHIARTVDKVLFDDRDNVVTLLADHAPALSFREFVHASKFLLACANPGQTDRELALADDRVHFGLYRDGVGYRAEGWFTNEQGAILQSVLDAHTSVTTPAEIRTRNERQGDAIVEILRQYAESDVIPNLGMARPRLVVLTTCADLRAIAANEVPGDWPMTHLGDTLDHTTTKRLMSDADVVPVVVDDSSTQTVADIALDPRTAASIRAREAFFANASRRSQTDRPRGAPPMLLRLLTTPVRPLALGRSHRVVPGWLRDAVILRDRQCVVEGCEVQPQRCEVHHVVPWALGGATDLPNLALLCVRHHRSVETGTWQLRPRSDADGPGRYWVTEHCRRLLTWRSRPA